MREDIKIIATEWRSGRNIVGIILVQSEAGNQRAYIGIWPEDDFNVTSSEKEVANSIADWGCKLSYEEAEPFFKHTELLVKDKYQLQGDLI